MVTYSHASTPLSQSERAYYLSYFINEYNIYFQLSCGVVLTLSEMTVSMHTVNQPKPAMVSNYTLHSQNVRWVYD